MHVHETPARFIADILLELRRPTERFTLLPNDTPPRTEQVTAELAGPVSQLGWYREGFQVCAIGIVEAQDSAGIVRE